MRRFLLVVLGLVCALSFGPHPEAEAADDVQGLLADCTLFSGHNRSWCTAEQTRFVEMYRRSLEKDYHSQRSVASCLFGGCDGAVTIDKKHACAWRLLILESGYTFVDSTDKNNHRQDCKGLDSNKDGLDIRSYADALMVEIYGKSLPALR